MQSIGYMGKQARSGGRLQIHRETLRALSAESLERVAGGNEGDFQDPNPRTNAWTGRVVVKEAAIDPIEVCR